jgi:hypothetical protein
MTNENTTLEANASTPDMKLFFSYHVVMMVMFAVGGGLPIIVQLSIALLVIVVLVILSIRRRRIEKWKWSGLTGGRLARAVGSIVLVGLFLFSASPSFQLHLFPWFLAGAGFGILGALSSLKIVEMKSKADLAEATKDKSQRLPWKRRARLTFQVCGLCLFLAGNAWFYAFSVNFNAGSPEPDATHVEALSNHGRKVYITHGQMRILTSLENGFVICIPSVLLAGVILSIKGVNLSYQDDED